EELPVVCEEEAAPRPVPHHLVDLAPAARRIVEPEPREDVEARARVDHRRIVPALLALPQAAVDAAPLLAQIAEPGEREHGVELHRRPLPPSADRLAERSLASQAGVVAALPAALEVGAHDGADLDPPEGVRVVAKVLRDGHSGGEQLRCALAAAAS